MSTLEKHAMLQDKDIPLDRLRYTKNKLSANLVLLAIVFDVLFFVSIYKSDVGQYYYTMLTGASIIYNLIFLLIAFLSEEGVKNRRPNFHYVLVALGLGQIIRIFIIPMQAHAAMVTIGGANSIVMADGQFIRVIVYLVLSAVCCIAAGIWSYIQNKKLNDYMKTLAA